MAGCNDVATGFFYCGAERAERFAGKFTRPEPAWVVKADE